MSNEDPSFADFAASLAAQYRTTPAAHEPAADVRQGAAALKSLFDALVQVGFTEGQAMVLLCQYITVGSGQ